ncbi:MAG: type II toxin-antitoxin system VapC family toxin [Phyllobacterium sp.]
METLVIDASIAVKWVVEEDGTQAALDLRSRFRFIAPELLVAECANILWKKVQRGELLLDEAVMASRLLERAGIEFVSMREMLKQATELAIALAHPAYDCIYLAVARQKNAHFVTADQRLLRVIAERASNELAGLCISLSDVQSSSH